MDHPLHPRLRTPFTPIAVEWGAVEGPAFDRHGGVFFVSSDRGAIVHVGPDGAGAEWANTGGIPAALAFGSDGTLYITDSGPSRHGVLVATADGVITTLVDAFEGAPFNGCNDLVFAPDGTLYFSDPWQTSLENPTGGFYRRFPDGGLERLDHGLAFPNGVALAPDASAVFLAETGTNRVYRYSLTPNGTIGPRETFAQFDGDIGPDGMAFDAEGILYVAHYSQGRLDLLDPTGRIIDAIPVPGPEPTNLAFGGPARRTLIVTENSTGTVYRAEVVTPGAPLFGDVP
jgi:gluconolactonase